MKAFQAYSEGCCVTALTPRKAAEGFFINFPKKRKCNVVEGNADGYFFTVTYKISPLGERPQNWKNITKKDAHNLPDII